MRHCSESLEDYKMRFAMAYDSLRTVGHAQVPTEDIGARHFLMTFDRKGLVLSDRLEEQSKSLLLIVQELIIANRAINVEN